VAPKLGEQLIVMIEQGGTAEEAFNAVDGTIDSMTKTMVFSHCKPSPYSGVAIDHELYKKNRDVDVDIEFEVLKVKVLVIFLGTVGFSLRREGR
jgi:hypothetical protein